jgi:hypothetical protein
MYPILPDPIAAPMLAILLPAASIACACYKASLRAVG